MRLRNESGVFESAATVDIDGPIENKLKLEEQKKKEEEEKQKQLEEEKARKEAEEEAMNAKNLLESKLDAKEEDRDSGLKIGDESVAGSDYEYTEGSEYEDYYEDEDEESEDNRNQTEDGIVVELVQDSSKNQIQNQNEENGELLVSSHEEKDKEVNMTYEHVEKNEEVIQTNDHEEKDEEINQTNEQKITNREDFCEVEDETRDSEDNPVTSQNVAGSDVDNSAVTELETDVLQDSSDDASQDIVEADDVCNDAESEVLSETKEILEENNSDEGWETTHYMSSCATTEQEEAPDTIDNQEGESLDRTDIEDTKYFKNSDEENEEDIAFLIEECEVDVRDPPTLVFNKEEYLKLMNEQLDKNLEAAGFSKSSLSNDLSVEEGDRCLLNLLDQMKREDQDFKVWERDDFSFLRWYVTRQMETLHGKVENLKFVEMIREDFQSYIDKMSQDGVPIDRVFIQAIATIFNKDIILIPVDGETDFEVVVGGLNNGKSKGNPLYLGHIRKTDNCPDIFVSVMPENIDNSQISSILAGELTFGDRIVMENTDTDKEKIDSAAGESNPSGQMTGINQWKRMDSFTGSSSKVDVMINDIISGDNLNELFSKLDNEDEDDDDDDFDEDSDSVSECETVASAETIHFSEPDNCEASESRVCQGTDGGAAETEDWQYDDQAGCWIKMDNRVEAVETEGAIEEEDEIVDLQEEPEGAVFTEYHKEVRAEEEALGDTVCAEEEVMETESEDTTEYEQSLTKTDTDIVENVLTDIEEENDCEGWAYDEESGYWIEKSEKNTAVVENNDELKIVNDEIVEEDQRVAEFEEGGLQAEERDLGYAVIETEMCNEDIECKQEEDITEMSQECEENEDRDETIDNKSNYFQERVITDIDTSNETETLYGDEVALRNEINTSEKVVCDIKSQDTQIRRKIKISVSVSDNDQVKESDLLQQCDPVTLESESSNACFDILFSILLIFLV